MFMKISYVFQHLQSSYVHNVWCGVVCLYHPVVYNSVRAEKY